MRAASMADALSLSMPPLHGRRGRAPPGGGLGRGRNGDARHGRRGRSPHDGALRRERGGEALHGRRGRAPHGGSLGRGRGGELLVVPKFLLFLAP